jgi:predicted nucleotidyltransferase
MKVSDMATRPDIDGMVRRIVSGFAPERIILFGSHARGSAGPDSDVDLLVVMRSDLTSRRQVVEIRKVLADLPIAKDIIVVSPEYFDRYRDVVGTVVWPAVREGKVLYEQRAA